MQTYRVKTTVSADGTVVVTGTPFSPGDEVEVIVRIGENRPEGQQRYPLRGKPIRYIDPFASVADNDWEALQ